MSKSFRAPLLLLALSASAVGTSFAFDAGPEAGVASSPAAESAPATPSTPARFDGETDPPVIWIDYTSPTVGTTATIVINYCDDVSMVASTRYLTVNGVVVSTGYAAGSYGGCTVYATSTVVVNLSMGNNALYAKIRGDNFEWGEAYATIVRVAPTFRVTATPDGAVVSKSASTASTHWFKITNAGNVATTFQLSASCAGAGIASGCSLSSSSRLIAGSTTDSVYVSFTTGSTGTVGRIDFTADSGGVVDDAYVTINVPAATPAANYPVVDLSRSHPGTTEERSACLSIGVGPNAAYECGDLRLTHALPTVTTLNRTRTPTLIYNSMLNRPYEIVSADVSVPSGSAGVPDSVTAALSIDGTPVNSGKWTGSAWLVGGPSRRIGLGYDASLTGTGIRGYSMEVAFFIGGTRYATTKTGELAVVDRRTSEFGAGWWLVGLEQLSFVSGGRVLWVGGDGSTRVYTNEGLVPSTGTRRWVAPGFDRPDSMFHDTTSGHYTRHHSGGVRVVFNGAGQHISTVNRLGHTTTFARTGARLDSIVVPPASAGMVYRFSYTGSARLSSVAVRGPTGGSTRTMTVTDSAGVIKTIRDPGDTISVTFSYVSPTNANVLGRRDRSGHWIVYSYDPWNRLSQAHDTAGAEVLVDTLVAAESRGQPGYASLRTDSVFSRVNGPRNDATDAADVMLFQLDRYGAPTLLKDALGHITTIERGDVRWPGVATRVRWDNGRVVVSLHDMRGNLRSTTDSSLYQGGRYATSRYEWDTKWDHVTKASSPAEIVTRMAYDAANGNRSWQEDGRGISSRVNFAYWPTGVEAGLLRSTELPGAIRDTVKYDAVLGNLAVTRTPTGHHTKFTRDSIGRVATTRAQVEAATSVDAKAEEQRITYDLRDLVTASVRYGPPMNGVDSQKVVVENSYDNERRPTMVRRKSDPDLSSIGWISTSWMYDALGRRVVEVSSDGERDSTVYDAAGNAIKLLTRRGDTIWTQYDALSRATRKIVSAATDTASYRFGAAAADATNPDNPPYGGYAFTRDTTTFEYDGMGRLERATNRDARIRRTYTAFGALDRDSLWIKTWARDAELAYGTRYEYDIEGRVTALWYPAQLVAGTQSKATYAYNATTGSLDEVRGLENELFSMSYNDRSELTQVVMPGNIIETNGYDTAGQLTLHRIENATPVNLTDRYAAGWIDSTRVWYDLRGRLDSTVNKAGPKDKRKAKYTGLGHVYTDTVTASGVSMMGNALTAVVNEVFAHDALGNVRWATESFTATAAGGWSTTSMQSSTAQRVTTYQSSTARLLTQYNYQNTPNTQTFRYDKAGNMTLGSTATPNIFGQIWRYDDHASYYDAAGRVVQAERRLHWRQDGTEWEATAYLQRFEDSYRYDPLGRRVLVRSTTSCHTYTSALPMNCNLGTLRRTVWAGDRELMEIQRPVANVGGWTVAQMESDTSALAFAIRPAGPYPTNYDPNPQFGRVAYTHGLGIDRPLSVTRLGYVDRNRLYPTEAAYAWPTFTFIPHWNGRGEATTGTFSNGAARKRTTVSGHTREVVVEWPLGALAYNRLVQDTIISWHGTLIHQKQDQVGTLYRRNRYYDPTSGRFTQEDPIGLAGGLNLYGYAGGDPINFSDPFGLCPEAKRDKDGNCPGGISVKQWEAVDAAAGRLHADVAALIRAKLAAGEIHAGEEADASIMGRGDPVSGDITLMTNTWYGSAFDLGASDLGMLVAHEYRHTTQLTGVSAAVALTIRREEARLPWRLRPMERDAEAFACESMLPSARSTTRVPSQLPCR